MKRDTGARFERKAVRHLQSQGLKLIECNFQCRHGEIDLIMRHGKCLAFIEVRYRMRNRFTTASGSIDCRKQHRIINTAAVFLAKHPQFSSDPVRFDVIAFDATEDHRGRIQWLQDAFRP